MEPVWKRHSQEQRLRKAPQQEAVPQHGDDVEVRKVPVQGKQGRPPSGPGHLFCRQIRCGVLLFFSPSPSLVMLLNTP